MRLIIFLLLFTDILSAQTQKIGYSLSVLSGQGTDLETLFDNNTQTGWFPGWNQGDYPVKVLVEFEEPQYLSKIRFYDWVGKPNLTFKTIGGTVLLKKELGLYGQWQEWDITHQEKISNLTFEISDIQGDRPITELEFYGSDMEPEPPLPPIKFSGDALKLGVNGFHWVPQELNPTSNLRMYQMFEWTWRSDGVLFEPNWINGNYDSYLQGAKDKGKTVIYCINKIPFWMSNQSTSDWQWSRIHRDGKNGSDPFSYKEVGEYAWQVTARYGSKSYPSEFLDISQEEKYPNFPLTVPKSGLNLISYLELENEPDRPWNEPLYKYSPQELAALMSAIWDGHEGKLGPKVGVKNADPNIKVVLPGLSTLNVWYISEMKKWFESNRVDKKFCADVLNFHHYCNLSNPWPGIEVNLVNGFGISPDDDHLEFRLQETNLWCRSNLPQCQVWFSEFGYDTSPPSTILSQYPQLYGNKTAVELQGQWLLRTYLIGLATGIDKIFMFNLCDENSSQSGYVFGSSGLLSSEVTSFKKKQSWKDLDWLVREITGFKFYKDRTINPNIRIFEFRNRLQSKYFYYCPTSNGSTSEFKIGGKKLFATENVQVYSVSRFMNNTTVYSNEEKSSH